MSKTTDKRQCSNEQWQILKKLWCLVWVCLLHQTTFAEKWSKSSYDRDAKSIRLQGKM